MSFGVVVELLAVSILVFLPLRMFERLFSSLEALGHLILTLFGSPVVVVRQTALDFEITL